jgi:hypothetical protein
MQYMQYRQGDVFIETVTALPDGGADIPRVNGRLVLAEGEATGHAHAIAARQAQLREVAGAVYLTLLTRAWLRHEEHDPIQLPPGIYRVRRQREYTPEGLRNVAD